MTRWPRSVLNHLTDPSAGFAELARVTRAGGAILATAFADEYRSEDRDRIDAAAIAAGWQAPRWYRNLKSSAMPLLGTAPAMAAAARAAGLAGVRASHRAVDTGITEPAQLVRYRLGHPIFAAWLDRIGPERAANFAAEAEQAVGGPMAPYRPSVIFLRARTAARPRQRP